MASAEARGAYAANNCFNQGFKMPPNSSDCPSSVSKILESDWTPSNYVNDHANSGGMPHKSDRLPNMKWWLHVKTNLGDEVNYTCQHLNSWEAELGTFCGGFVDENTKTGGDQSIENFDALSCTGSANSAVQQPWHVSPTRMKKKNNTRMPKIETAVNNDLQLMAKKKDLGEFWFCDGQLMDWDITNSMTFEQCKRTSSDLESHWMGAEKTEPWWRTAGKDELASLVAQKSLEHIENCDLPRPHFKHFSKSPSVYQKAGEDGKTLPSSLNQKAKLGSSRVDGYAYGTPTSGCSFEDSDRRFSSSQSKDSYSSTKNDQMNSEVKNKAKLLEALCHSQTRAREAEKAAQQAFIEKEHIVSLFFRQASQLFAYKQWFHMLQLENLCLQLRIKNQPLFNLFPEGLPWVPYRGKQLKNNHHRGGKRKGNNRRCSIRKCAVAFAVGLGLAGAGLLLGWSMGWMFPTI